MPFLGKEEGMFRIFAAVDVEAAEMFGAVFDAADTERDAAVRVGAAKAAAVAPSDVEMVVGTPGDGPEIAAGGGGLAGVPMPGYGRDKAARRIRRRGGGGSKGGGETKSEKEFNKMKQRKRRGVFVLLPGHVLRVGVNGGLRKINLGRTRWTLRGDTEKWEGHYKISAFFKSQGREWK